ncbi:hypothetical protein BAE44_0018289 [Dichanthelium oligosanthes]|uniref:No apical meristem-associated C-terminal domain-containing protein n=1 Tax=Dichanthelium oligosanthes TaxID=888268 RepID=A0A1E5V6C2_9POAL|nr:hypothetical protein BAE44_0018289 [Dichanthelium oligosanthes]
MGSRTAMDAAALAEDGKMSWTPEEGLAWAIHAMQAHADNVRLLVHESFATAYAVPTHDLNRLLLTLEELADELDKVSVNCAELLPPLSNAMWVFEAVEGHQFNFLHCWVILRNERKWEDKMNGVKEGRTRSRMPADPSASAKGTDSEAPDSAARPMGRDAAKKRRSMQQGSESSSAYLEVLQRMTVSREVMNQA